LVISWIFSIRIKLNLWIEITTARVVSARWKQVWYSIMAEQVTDLLENWTIKNGNLVVLLSPRRGEWPDRRLDTDLVKPRRMNKNKPE